ncbi:MAG TPA: hypothetical protein PLY87_10700 [Planctomycetaceae bacterium]|nr:hypothetical protein [Planctomycetaceae bacterium]HRA87941.1 hypothetical protein [Planctomycetaceae bacterium]
MERFECDKCGACCQGSLIVEADDLDVMREPRLIAGDESQGDRSVEQVVREIQTEGKIVLLACGSACAFPCGRQSLFDLSHSPELLCRHAGGR